MLYEVITEGIVVVDLTIPVEIVHHVVRRIFVDKNIGGIRPRAEYTLCDDALRNNFV